MIWNFVCATVNTHVESFVPLERHNNLETKTVHDTTWSAWHHSHRLSENPPPQTRRTKRGLPWDPESWILNPESWIPKLESWILNPESWIPVESWILNPESWILNPESRKLNPESWIPVESSKLSPESRAAKLGSFSRHRLRRSVALVRSGCFGFKWELWSSRELGMEKSVFMNSLDIVPLKQTRNVKSDTKVTVFWTPIGIHHP